MTEHNHRCDGDKSLERVAFWRSLPRDTRLIRLGRCVGFSEAEIAARLGKSLFEVRAAYYRAKGAIRERRGPTL